MIQQARCRLVLIDAAEYWMPRIRGHDGRTVVECADAMKIFDQPWLVACKVRIGNLGQAKFGHLKVLTVHNTHG